MSDIFSLIKNNDIFSLIENNDINSIKQYINNGYDIDVLNDKNITPLVQAILLDNYECVNLLMDAKCDYNIIFGQNGNYYNIIMLMISLRRDKMLELLFEKNIKFDENVLNLQDEHGNSALILMILYGKFKYINIFKNSNLNIQRYGRHINKIYPKYNALMFAAEYGTNSIIRSLIEFGANLDLTNSINESALIIALKNKNKRSAKILINAGCDLNIIVKNNYYNALMIAIMNNLDDMCKLLIENDCDLTHRDYNKKTFLHYICQYNSVEVLNTIL